MTVLHIVCGRGYDHPVTSSYMLFKDEVYPPHHLSFNIRERELSFEGRGPKHGAIRPADPK